MVMPRHKPSDAYREQVERMAGFGFTVDQICIALDIAERTLYRYYRDELKRGHVTVNMKVANKLYRMTQGNDRSAVTAQIFWLKTRMGWRETNNHEVSGPNGEPVELVIRRTIVDPKKP